MVSGGVRQAWPAAGGTYAVVAVVAAASFSSSMAAGAGAETDDGLAAAAAEEEGGWGFVLLDDFSRLKTLLMRFTYLPRLLRGASLVSGGGRLAVADMAGSRGGGSDTAGRGGFGW